MKKNLWFAAMVGVALTGCVSEESSPMEEQAQKLTFASVQSTQSRANFKGEIEGAIYPVNEEFKVYSVSYNGAYQGWEGSNVAPFFSVDGEVAGKQGDYWSTLAKDHYWPSRGYALAFGAYSPANLDVSGVSVNYDKTGLKINDFQVQTALDNQYDLMFSDRIYEQTYENHGSNPVVLTFNHALSSIVFAAAKSGVVNNKKYTIKGVTLSGSFVKSGDFSQNIEETSQGGNFTQTSSPSWDKDPAGEIINYSPSEEMSIEVLTGSTVLTKGKSAFLTIPQTVPEDAKVILNFEVEETVTGSQDKKYFTYPNYEISLLDFVDPNKLTINEWKMGYRYVYQVNFGGTPKIQFNPTVNQWHQGGTYTYLIQ